MRRVPDYYNRRVEMAQKKLLSDKEIRLNDRTGFRIFFFLANLTPPIENIGNTSGNAGSTKGGCHPKNL